MKKILALILAAMLLFAMAACGTEQNDENSAAAADTAVDVKTVASADGYENSGFTMFVCEETGTYKFWAENCPEEITWSVFLLDEEFTDGARYIPQAYECALEGDGVLDIAAGQYIYIRCSANAFTDIQPVDGAVYSFCLD